MALNGQVLLAWCSDIHFGSAVEWLYNRNGTLE